MAAFSRIGFNARNRTMDNPALAELLRRDKWPQLDVISHFIKRRSGADDTAAYALKSLLIELDKRYDELRCTASGSKIEMSGELEEQLKRVSLQLQEKGKKLLLVIDGLDESINDENNASVTQSVYPYIPAELPPAFFMVLSSRPRTEITKLRFRLKRNATECEATVNGLQEDDVRLILEKAAGSGTLDDAYVTAVTRKDNAALCGAAGVVVEGAPPDPPTKRYATPAEHGGTSRPRIGSPVREE